MGSLRFSTVSVAFPLDGAYGGSACPDRDRVWLVVEFDALCSGGTADVSDGSAAICNALLGICRWASWPEATEETNAATSIAPVATGAQEPTARRRSAVCCLFWRWGVGRGKRGGWCPSVRFLCDTLRLATHGGECGPVPRLAVKKWVFLRHGLTSVLGMQPRRGRRRFLSGAAPGTGADERKAHQTLEIGKG